MKRDMDLVRCILIILSNSDEEVRSDDPAFEAYSRQLVGYHFQILDEAGLIDAVVCGETMIRIGLLLRIVLLGRE